MSAYEHSLDRVEARYGIRVLPETLARKIEEDKAKFLGWAHRDRLIYSVPIGGVPGAGPEPIWINVVYRPNPTAGRLGWIITVLPAKLSTEIAIERKRQQKKRGAQIKKSFGRAFMQANADEDFENDFD